MKDSFKIKGVAAGSYAPHRIVLQNQWALWHNAVYRVAPRFA